MTFDEYIRGWNQWLNNCFRKMLEPIPRATGRWVIDDLYGVVMKKPRLRKRTTERKERG